MSPTEYAAPGGPGCNNPTPEVAADTAAADGPVPAATVAKAALEAASTRFREYATHHLTKNDPLKAERNASMADLCDNAIRALAENDQLNLPAPSAVPDRKLLLVMQEVLDGAAALTQIFLLRPGDGAIEPRTAQARRSIERANTLISPPTP